MRVGFGYDVHRLEEGRKLILGGVQVPFEKGLLGHSDADVLLHAIVDAMLGAASKGDIGKLFPDTGMKFKDMDSTKFLVEAGNVLKNDGFKIINLDSTIVAQRPKLAPYIEEMRKNISSALGLELNQVSVKATTTEGLGFTGTGEGIAAYAVASIEQIG